MNYSKFIFSRNSAKKGALSSPNTFFSELWIDILVQMEVHQSYIEQAGNGIKVGAIAKAKK